MDENLERLQAMVDLHDRILRGDGSDELGVQTQLALIRQDLSQLKWGGRILATLCAGWLVTQILELLT